MLRQLFLASLLAALVGTVGCFFPFGPLVLCATICGEAEFLPFLGQSLVASWFAIGLPTVLLWLLFSPLLPAIERWYWIGRPPGAKQERNQSFPIKLRATMQSWFGAILGSCCWRSPACCCR